MNLTQEQRNKINQFIAEKCGWTRVGAGWLHGSLCGVMPNKCLEVHGSTFIPDYCASLDACHEALICLGDNYMDADQWEAFGRRVEFIHPTATLSYGEFIDYHDFSTLLCTPSDQIALALFQTLGGEL